jgi:hypothetical protein
MRRGFMSVFGAAAKWIFAAFLLTAMTIAACNIVHDRCSRNAGKWEERSE